MCIRDRDKFQKKCDQYKEFLVLYDRHPKRNGKGHNEHDLSLFKKKQRHIMYNTPNDMRPERIKMLDDVHPGILNHALPYNCIDNKEPSAAWKEVFNGWANETTEDEVRAYTFPTISDSYVPTAMSFQEHLIIKTGMHRYFEPKDCDPYNCCLSVGTMQHVASYLLHPEYYRVDQKKQSTDSAAVFEKNVFDGEHPPPPRSLRHQYSGTLFPSKHTSSEIRSLMKLAYNELFNVGDMLQDIRDCNSVTDYAGVLKRYEHCIDTFNYANRGLNGEVENILQLPQFQQPLRIGFSCALEPARYFPSLGVFCQLLFAYGAAGRPMIAGTCRPIKEHCFLLGELVWRTCNSELSPICQKCPPWSMQALIYTDLWLEDEEGLLEGIKERQNKKKTKAATTKSNKHKNNNVTNNETGGSNIQTRSVKQRLAGEKTNVTSDMTINETTTTKGKGNLTIRKTKTVKKKMTTAKHDVPPKRHHKKGEMRPHHDNGRRDVDSGAHVGANPDKEVNSHIYGSCVLMVTFGDAMEYHLIRASNKSDNPWQKQEKQNKMQDYTMSQEEAIHNLRDHKSKNKKSPLTLVKTVQLDECSLYVHSAHDDEVYFHALDFAEQLKKKNRVRLVLVYRWLAVSQYFRQSADDPSGNRYSMISKYGFEMLDQRPNDAQSWWKAMQYVDDNGDNIIKNLMGPFVTNDKKQKKGKQQKGKKKKK